jgi:hypothetical protein
MAALSEPTWRLVPSRFPPLQAFESVASAADLPAAMELEGWTDDRLVEERLRRLPRAQWVFGRANASLVMAAFLHVSPDGGRFNGPDLGAWYGSLDLKTAIAEVAHHLRREAIRAGRREYTVTYGSYEAILLGEYDDLRARQGEHPSLYDPRSWKASQAYGERRRAEGADGLMYDSLRLRGGIDVAAFKPTNVSDVVAAGHFRITASLDTPPVARRLRPA